MMGTDDESYQDAGYKVGFRRPPLHTRFKPGVSGNPSGRRKGSQNLKTLFHKILNEEIALRTVMGPARSPRPRLSCVA
jgi:Family of unknown function (DUF5681)